MEGHYVVFGQMVFVEAKDKNAVAFADSAVDVDGRLVDAEHEETQQQHHDGRCCHDQKKSAQLSHYALSEGLRRGAAPSLPR
jgi:hypothetical protein